MISHIQGCVEHALKEDNAGVFGTSPQPSKPAPAMAGKKTGTRRAK